MKPEVLSSGAALVSALSALLTTYWYRKQGKGFVWTKDQIVNLNILPSGDMDLTVQIPIYNLGLGNIQFKSLHAKKVSLKTNSIENYECDFDQAFFPPGVQIVKYRTPIFSDHKHDGSTLSTQLLLNTADPAVTVDQTKLQQDANKKLEDFGEVVFILKCVYLDGSWFGLGKKTTIIGMTLKGGDLTWLSSARRKELDKLFS